MVALFVFLAFAAPNGLRCFTLGPGVALRRADVTSIKSVVRAWSGRPAMSIELPVHADPTPTGTLEVVTLLRGSCDAGEGDRLWVRKGARGWRVVRNVGREGWETLGLHGE